MLFYALTIFISAFLLFQVQPVIARLILPWFGGAAGVWITCLLFFQVVLLLGYLYAHGTTRYLAARRQTLLHVALLAGSTLLLPITPNEAWKPVTAGDPTVRILGLLASTIGLPYLLLSATSPLLQAWYTQSRKEAMPYRLFALSNAGCLLGLITYPVLFEPFIPTHSQTLWWSYAYVGFALLCGATALGQRGESNLQQCVQNGKEAVTATRVDRPAWDVMALWVAMAACGSMLLLGITNHLTKNVAPIPFLWVLPLSIYLSTLILCFDRPGWYKREWYLLFLVADLVLLAHRLFLADGVPHLKLVIGLFASLLLICCMVCHGELAHHRPAPQQLTSFYLMMALGGAIGGGFVALAAPHLFGGYYELPFGVAACAFLPLLVMYRNPSKPYVGSARLHARLAMVALALIMLVVAVGVSRASVGQHRFLARNFYGSLWTADSGLGTPENAMRIFINGGVNHGEQFLAPQRRRQPTTYYGPPSGVGLALLQNPEWPKRVGLIGLGSGTLASYAREGDYYRFYEINPLVIHVANTEFTFLKDCPARIDVVEGDGRLALEREPSQEFDVLVADAFSGDAVPVHLLTEQAFALYFRHLRKGGVLAVHVTNTYLDLAPIVQLGVVSAGKEAVLVASKGENEKGFFSAVWVLATDRREFIDRALSEGWARRIEPRPGVHGWTDDYSNLLSILRTKSPINDATNFLRAQD